jgi:hypothetical protein
MGTDHEYGFPQQNNSPRKAEKHQKSMGVTQFIIMPLQRILEWGNMSGSNCPANPIRTLPQHYILADLEVEIP